MFKKILMASSLIISSYIITNDMGVEASIVDTTPYTYFSDVPATNSHAPNIYTLYRIGGINGYGDGSYGTSKEVSREHIVAIMYRLLKDEASIIRPAKTFKDVPTSHTYYNEITWAYQTGLIDGSGDYFNPKNLMTREQMSKVLANGFGFIANKNHTFKDVNKNYWSYEFVNALYENGITQISDFKYNPKNNVTRGQLASFLIRSLEKEDKYNIGINFIREVPNHSKEESKNPIIKEDNKEESKKPVVTDGKESFDSGYGFNWYADVGSKTLHLHGINNKNQVVGEFVKGDGKSLEGVSINTTQQELERLFGSNKVSHVQYKDGAYNVSNFKDEMFIFEKNNNIIHAFLDKHNNNRVTSVLSISKDVYKNKPYYEVGKDTLREDYENLMVLLINQSRKDNGLSSVVNKNDDYVDLARNHSIDMATNNYFSHESPDGKSVLSTRFQQYNIPNLYYYGENIAAGQETVIQAHEGLMNSLGHRKNILSDNFDYVVSGVAFNSKNTPYYTINFYSTN